MSATNGRRLALLGALVMAATTAAAQTTDRPSSAMDGNWHFTLAPYFTAAGIKGDLSVGPLTVPVDASFSDVLENLDMTFQGHFEARKNRFGFAADVIYMNLGAAVGPDLQLVDFNIDHRQIITEGDLFFRVASGGRADNPAHLDILAGARYVGTETKLEAKTADGVEYDGASHDVSWVDLVGGARFRVPLGSRAALIGRGDVGGLGSKLSYNLEGDLAFFASSRWTIGAGWRYLDFDYEEDEGAQRKKVDLAYSGPRLWFAYSW